MKKTLTVLMTIIFFSNAIFAYDNLLNKKFLALLELHFQEMM